MEIDRLDRLLDVVGGVAREGVVKVADKVVSVISRKGHEGSAHHDELDLVGAVSKTFELRDSVSGLEIRIVALITIKITIMIAIVMKRVR